MSENQIIIIYDLVESRPRFGEFCSCGCLPLLPQLACSILATWDQPYSETLYEYFFLPHQSHLKINGWQVAEENIAFPGD